MRRRGCSNSSLKRSSYLLLWTDVLHLRGTDGGRSKSRRSISMSGLADNLVMINHVVSVRR